MIASSGVETRIRALGTRFVAIFRFREICDVDYNLSSKITTLHGYNVPILLDSTEGGYQRKCFKDVLSVDFPGARKMFETWSENGPGPDFFTKKSGTRKMVEK